VQKPCGKALRRKNNKKTPQKHSFLCFFPLQPIRLSRIIGLTKEEIEHFRIVLFFETSPVRASECKVFFHIKQRI